MVYRPSFVSTIHALLDVQGGQLAAARVISVNKLTTRERERERERERDRKKKEKENETIALCLNTTLLTPDSTLKIVSIFIAFMNLAKCT